MHDVETDTAWMADAKVSYDRETREFYGEGEEATEQPRPVAANEFVEWWRAYNAQARAAGGVG